VIVFGLVVLALAGVALAHFIRQRRKLRATQTAETLSCDDLGELARAVRDEVEGVGFARVCEVVGEAVPHESGVLTAIESRHPCVWHRAVLTEHYWDWERDSDGDRHRRRKKRQIHAQASETTFLVDDDTGTIAIDPRAADVDGAEKVVDRMDENIQTGSQLMWLAEAIFTAGDRTIGVQHEEWIVRPGTRLYVLGEARDAGNGRLEMRKPAEGDMILSTRSEQEFAAATAKSARLGLLAAIGLGALGVALVVLSFIV
jgi:hypothetical protein